MPNYDNSNLALFQALLTGRFATEAKKSTNAVSYMAIADLARVMDPAAAVGRTREDRAVQAYTFARTKRAATGARSGFHVGPKGDSVVYDPTWQTRADSFQISIKQGDISKFSFREEFENEIDNSVKNLMDDAEELAQSFLFANRSPVNASTSSTSSFDVVDFTHKITETTLFGESQSGVTMSQITDTVMQENLLTGSYLVFCDSAAFDKFRRLSEQGNMNANNTAFQIANKTFIRSIGMDTKYGALVGGYNKGNWLTVPVGDVAHLSDIPNQNRDNYTSRIQTYGTLINPLDNLTYALHHYESKTDDTTANGYTQDELLQYELSIDRSFGVAPLTDATERPIHSFSLV